MEEEIEKGAGDRGNWLGKGAQVGECRDQREGEGMGGIKEEQG